MVMHKNFWLSAHSFLNDEKEYHEGLNILEQKLDLYINKAGSYSQETTQELLSHVKEVMIYSTSFSRKGDLLSQWRSYCPKEGGVAIGFDKTMLEKHFCGRQELTNFKYIEDCCYDSKHTGEVADIIAKSTVENLDRMGPSWHGHFSQENIFLEMLTFLARTKNSSFSEEAEVRLFSYGNRELDGISTQEFNEYSSIQLVNSESVSFRPKNNFLIPYLEIGFPIEAIQEIKVGPSNFQRESILGLTMFIKNNNLDVNITCSEIPYRVI